MNYQMFPEVEYQDLYHKFVANSIDDENDEYEMLEEIIDGSAPEEYQMINGGKEEWIYLCNHQCRFILFEAQRSVVPV
ncbi:hypothetical protein L6452_18109 [Arctium lappa]|uniref:Uncharacterized protein n=1 Tax=Arctium lappa TaxID=4217 RepID=A0ACB9C5F5_ARCLA|nr:hypothetical protein L6452_18109 [Arctium lappa]